MIKFEMTPNLYSILQNLKPYKFDKEKKFFVSDLARNLNPGTLKRFLAKKIFEIFFRGLCVKKIPAKIRC